MIYNEGSTEENLSIVLQKIDRYVSAPANSLSELERKYIRTLFEDANYCISQLGFELVHSAHKNTVLKRYQTQLREARQRFEARGESLRDVNESEIDLNRDFESQEEPENELETHRNDLLAAHRSAKGIREHLSRDDEKIRSALASSLELDGSLSASSALIGSIGQLRRNQRTTLSGVVVAICVVLAVMVWLKDRVL